MIDIALLRGDDAQKYIDNILRKEPGFDVYGLIEADQNVRSFRQEVEELLSQKNKLSKNPENIEAAREQSIELGKKIKAQKAELEKLESKFEDLLLCCPNFISDLVPSGNKESNKVVRSWGEPREFGFTPKNHVELNEEAGWFDFKVGAKISKTGFVYYKENGVKLMYALTKLLLKHNKKWGFEPVIPPTVVSKDSLWRNGSLPKFAGDYYDLKDDDLALIPTAEVCMTSVHAEETFAASQLPIRNTAWTSCFRREAGGYGANERGLIRIHQFEKVELYSISDPQKSDVELERMVACAEEFLQKLEIPHQVSLLAAQDCSFVSNRTYDIEVWLPGQKKYYEVSSCSNCKDFQSRRAKIKFKRTEGSKPELVHTLNASSLALPRLVVALMENHQQPTGEIKLPAFLQKEMDELW